jgi:two-component system, NtrC family, sensor histidine kinase HydH
MTTTGDGTRAHELFRAQRDANYVRTDRVFAALMAVQWAFAILIAVVWSPYGWEGRVQSVHAHVYAAVFLGGLLSSFPIALALLRPGAAITRNVIAIAQMLWSALLIHLSGGRIETHFHVFGSLAFIAFYRDWKTLVPATVVVASDHLLRQLFWPESVYGITSPEWWRFLEHAGWVVFEDVILVLSCVRGVEEMRVIADRQAEVEALSDSVVRKKSIALEAALAELQASQEKLVRTEKLAAVGQLGASVSHELRNPLMAVKNAASYLQKRVLSPAPNAAPLASDARVAQFFGIIERELQMSNKIITDLLDFARERPAQLGPCALRPLVEESLGVLHLGGRSVDVINDVPDTLPIPSLDRDQFRQALINLIQNAAEAFPPELERRGQVRVHAEAIASGVRVRVIDDGAGIRPDDIPKIFEPLFTTKAKGTGLGLGVVASIVRRHGGSIRVDSELGRGTTVSIELPIGAEVPQLVVGGAA